MPAALCSACVWMFAPPLSSASALLGGCGSVATPAASPRPLLTCGLLLCHLPLCAFFTIPSVNKRGVAPALCSPGPWPCMFRRRRRCAARRCLAHTQQRAPSQLPSLMPPVPVVDYVPFDARRFFFWPQRAPLKWDALAPLLLCSMLLVDTAAEQDTDTEPPQNLHNQVHYVCKHGGDGYMLQ